jgi:hypothetical protein
MVCAEGNRDDEVVCAVKVVGEEEEEVVRELVVEDSACLTFSL